MQKQCENYPNNIEISGDEINQVNFDIPTTCDNQENQLETDENNERFPDIIQQDDNSKTVEQGNLT